MQAIKNYRLSEERAEQRLAEWRETDHPSALTREIALIRAMIEGAASSGQHSMANTLCNTLGKLSRSQLAHSRAMGTLLDREVVLRLGADLVHTIANEFSAVLDFDERVARASDKMTAQIFAAKNRGVEI
jgi:hypothetical protein